MSGMFAFVFGACLFCRQPFGFNPHKVPSIRVNAEGQPDETGKREPICARCVDGVNATRAAAGLELWVVPPDAYEAIPEGEL